MITTTSLADKAHAYCDINDMHYPDRLDESVYALLTDTSYEKCIAWNTQDFLIHGLWQLAHWQIDDEQFFQIGDVGGIASISADGDDAPMQHIPLTGEPLKQPRPHLNACEGLSADLHEHTLYIIDHAAQIAYTHKTGADARETLQQTVKSKHSAIAVI